MAEKKPEWVKMKPAEVEQIVIDLAKKEETPEKIGLILRDTHGVPKVKLVGKKIGKILEEAKIKVSGIGERTQLKIDNVEKHILKNKHDYTALRSLQKRRWIVNKSNKNNSITAQWSYNTKVFLIPSNIFSLLYLERG